MNKEIKLSTYNYERPCAGPSLFSWISKEVIELGIGGHALVISKTLKSPYLLIPDVNLLWYGVRR
jgi:hypothetical protein